jgi:hypothetical protein
MHSASIHYGAPSTDHPRFQALLEEYEID